MKFVIDVTKDSFSAEKDGELIADSRSANDLLAVFNEIVKAAGSDNLCVTFKTGTQTN